MSRFDRRDFLQVFGAGTVAAGVGKAAATEDGRPILGNNPWENIPDRVWVGSEYWANPLQDWEIRDRTLMCTKAGGNRNVHWLTRSLGEKEGSFQVSAVISPANGKQFLDSKGSAGFRIGIKGPVEDYRSGVISGNGLDAGIDTKQGLFIGRQKSKTPPEKVLNLIGALVVLEGVPAGNSYRLTLKLFNFWGTKPEPIDIVTMTVPKERVEGGLALVNNFGGGGRRGQKPASGFGEFAFRHWDATGEKVEQHPERAFGPILFSQYTLSNQVLKLTAQMPPLGEADENKVRLEISPRKGKSQWETTIHPQACTATFRIENWDDTVDENYRLAWTQKFRDGSKKEYEWTGTIRKDPKKKNTITVADVSCNIHSAFPNAPYVANMAKLDPDLIAFTGDQFYESTGGFGIQTSPLEPAILDYLRKWWQHGWTWRELTRDRPSVSIPDDHDVYQGNIWGEGGAPKQKTQEAGGYRLPAEMVNVVHRTQTSHHPDPADETPAKQGISVYFGAMNYGRLSFAIIADRMFKTGPDGQVPPTGGRADHVTDPNFDPKTANVPGLKLLGDRQLKFLREWAEDWAGADMKAVISQTIFNAMATTHGGNRQRLVADYDTNGWPQSARDAALKEMRKAFAVHIAGDQHLPAVIHYGIEEHRDAGVAFAGPAVNVGYPRWWEPKVAGKNRTPGSAEYTGDFVDPFGNPLTVLAVKNGAVKPQGPLMEFLDQKASGLGVVRFDKKAKTITFECWPFLADPTEPHTHFPGWPVTVKMEDNYAKKAAALLPAIHIEGAANPVVQVINERTTEIEYTLRISGQSYRPWVFDETAPHTVKVGAETPETYPELMHLVPGEERTIAVKVS